VRSPSCELPGLQTLRGGKEARLLKVNLMHELPGVQGFTDFSAALMVACFGAGCCLGSFLGGAIGATLTFIFILPSS